MKNFLIVVLVAAAVGVGVYYGLNRKSLTPVDEFAPSSTAGTVTQSTEEAPSAKGTSVLGTLNDSVLAAVAIKPKNFSPVIEHIEKVKAKLRATTAWKKLDLDKALEGMSLDTLLQQAGQVGVPGAAGAPADLSALPVSPVEVFTMIQGIWLSLTEFTLALSSKDFALDPSSSIKAPGIHASATFADDAMVKQVSGFLKQMSDPAANAQPGMPVTIKAVGSDNAKYEFSLTGPVSIQGSVNFSDKRMSATIGTTDEAAFMGGNGAGYLVESAKWKKAAAALLPKPVIYTYLDNSRLKPYLENIMKLAMQMNNMGGEASPVNLSESVMGAWENFALVSMAVNFQQGFGARQCVEVAPDSDASKAYKNYFSESAKDAAAGGSRFQNLIGPKTMLAIRVPRRWALLAVDQVRDSMSPGAGGAADSPEWKQFYRQLDLIKSSVEKMKFDEIGLIVNSPAFGPMPEFGVLISSRESIILTEFASALSELITAVGQEVGAQDLPKVSVGKNTDPALGTVGERIELNISPGQTIPLVPISDTALVASESPELLQSAATQLDQPSTFFNSVQVADPDLTKKAATSDFYVFLNTAGLFELGKPFLPLLLMQKPELQLGMPEIDEVINAIQFGILAVQSSSEASEGEMCSELRIGAF